MTPWDAASIKVDGKASIEHQIDIHVVDLAESVDNSDISAMDVLLGLKYVMDYRINGGKMPRLDQDLMKLLAKALLNYTGKKTGNLITQRPTEEADLSFTLFLNFLIQVEDFKAAVADIPTTDLCHFLKIHRRFQPRSTETQKQECIQLLNAFTQMPQFNDWKELVKQDDHDEFEKLLKEMPLQKPPHNPLATIFPPPALYFDKNSEKLAKMFGSNTETGLSLDQVAKLREKYGQNILPAPKKESILRMIFKQLMDFMIIVLIVVAIVECATGDYDAAIVLFLVVILNTIIGVYQENKAVNALQSLLTLSVPKATVIREGEQSVILSEDLVPGDLVVLEEGDAVPADLRLCQVSQLEIVEALLTGEPLGIPKSVRTIRQRTRKLPLGDCKGNAFMTTTISRGRGKGIVVRTGLNTEIGKISAAVSSAPNIRTSIERKLTSLGKVLILICLLLVVLIIVIGVAYQRNLGEMAKIGVSLGVSVVPEGLVAVVTVAIALGVSRMASKNCIVRNGPCVETVGSVTVICSDKTGTLTEGKMGAQELYTSDGANYVFSHSTSLDPNVGELKKRPEESLSEERVVSKNFDDAPGPLLASMAICSLCNNSSVGIDPETNTWKAIGDPTEIAMTLAALKSGFSADYFTKNHSFQKLGEYAFDSERKLMSSVYTSILNPDRPDDKACFVFCKGAPEAILQRSTSVLSRAKGDLSSTAFLNACSKEPIDDLLIDEISAKSAQMASQGLRVLALSLRRVEINIANEILQTENPSSAETDLVFVGLIGLIDPPKYSFLTIGPELKKVWLCAKRPVLES
jgi:Ca2+-transporting ATPase